MTRGDMVLAALQYYGQEAIAGGASNPVVVGFFQKAGHADVTNDDTPWCAAFLDAIARQVGAPRSSSLLATDWLSVGFRVDTPAFGDIVVFDWSKVGSTGHHVGIVVAVTGPIIWCLGGNQENRVEIRGYKIEAVAGYRRLLAE